MSSPPTATVHCRCQGESREPSGRVGQTPLASRARSRCPGAASCLECIQYLARQGRVEVGWDLVAAVVDADLSRASPAHRDKLGQGLVVSSDHDLLARPHALKKLREVGLRLMYAYACHVDSLA